MRCGARPLSPSPYSPSRARRRVVFHHSASLAFGAFWQARKQEDEVVEALPFKLLSLLPSSRCFLLVLDRAFAVIAEETARRNAEKETKAGGGWITLDRRMETRVRAGGTRSKGKLVFYEVTNSKSYIQRLEQDANTLYTHSSRSLFDVRLYMARVVGIYLLLFFVSCLAHEKNEKLKTTPVSYQMQSTQKYILASRK